MSDAKILKTDTDILNYLEYLVHDRTVVLERDWTYEMKVDGGEPMKEISVRECVEVLGTSRTLLLHLDFGRSDCIRLCCFVG